jgi:hypothetical protein
MEDRGTDAYKGNSNKHNRKLTGPRQKDQSDEGKTHACRERKRLRPFIGIHSYKGLEQGSRQLKAESYQPQLAEVEIQCLL